MAVFNINQSPHLCTHRGCSEMHGRKKHGESQGGCPPRPERKRSKNKKRRRGRPSECAFHFLFSRPSACLGLVVCRCAPCQAHGPRVQARSTYARAFPKPTTDDRQRHPTRRLWPCAWIDPDCSLTPVERGRGRKPAPTPVIT